MSKSAPASAMQRVYEHVRQKLRLGEFPQGTRLVTRNLAEELGTSINPVREALSRLASEHLVDHVPGAGTFVHRPDPAEIRDLYGMREAIESYAASEAARLIGEPELEILEETCRWWRDTARTMREQGVDRLPAATLAEWTARDERFHEIIVDAARNRKLSQSVSEHRVLTTIFRQHREIDLAITPDVADQVHESHSSVVEALRQRDSDSARLRMANLVQVGRRYVLGQLENFGSAR